MLETIIYSTILSLALINGSPDTGEKLDTGIVWHWEDIFSSVEKQQVEQWLTRVHQAVETTLGIYPFEIHFHIYRQNGSLEPVPWANTIRHSRQGVDFYIDPTYTLQSFLDDWTAPHEISHLSIPYLGSQHAWFAEGYASFMQYQIMERLGIYTQDQVKKKYAGKIEKARPYYDRPQDFVTVARELQSKNRYSDMYWGSASFFMRLDESLKMEYNLSLTTLIKEYLKCCRLGDDTIEEVILSWDQIVGGSTCSNMLKAYQTKPASNFFKSR